MISLKGVTKSYKMGETIVEALRGIDLEIEEGDFVAIMGPSGSGKSTLAHIIGLLDVPSGGSYKLNNQEVSGLSEDELAIRRRDEIGFIFQQFHLLPRLTTRENVALPTFYSKTSDGIQRAKKLLEDVGLGDRLSHHSNELSGGQQQRVAIARSLVNEPRLILADEPTGNLDSKSEQEILKALFELNAHGITIVIVTHEEEIGLKAKRLIRLRDGLISSDERREERVMAPPLESLSPRRRSAGQGIDPSEVLQHFKEGFKTLLGNKIRTGLSLLGILIGVAAVIAMLALGKGAQKSIQAQLSSLGSNLLMLHAGARKVGGVAQQAGTVTRITMDDVTAIKNLIPEVSAVSADVSGRAQVTYQDKNWNTQVQGSSPSYAKIRSAQPKVGRFFTQDENLQRARVAVIGATIVRELLGGKDPIGERIRINRVNFQVIGVLPAKGSNGWRDQDDLIVVPVLTAMHRLLGKTYLDDVEIQARDAQSVDIAQKKVLDLMNTRKRVPVNQKDNAFDVRNLADIQEAVTQSGKTMSALLASIAAVSLLVGGIGIMNIMLVSVTERTKEIGLRKAIGARRRDILMQFLAEAIVVSVAGGVMGIILGWAISTGLSLFTGWSTEVSIDSVLLAFGFSALIGIIFGIYPAKKASELSPIEALRYE